MTAKLSGNRLTTYYEDHLLWAHQFEENLWPDEVGDQSWRIHIGTLGADPEVCVLAVCRFKRSSQLYCFDARSELRWSLPAQPDLLDRDGHTFPNAWRFKHMIVGPPGPAQHVWMAFVNDAGWAGGILRIDPRGSASVFFANAGHVEQLALVTGEGDFEILFCGENNDFDQAFVGSIGTSDPFGCSPPGERPRYRYANAPSGAPRKYILFPMTELIEARDKPYGHAFALSRYEDDVIVDVETGGNGAALRYHFSPQLAPLYVFPRGSHEFSHRTLERAGKIAHAWRDCPEVRRPLELKVWERNSGWRTQAIPWRDTYPIGY